MLAGLLIVVLMQMDRTERPEPSRVGSSDEVIELVPPTALTREELEAPRAGRPGALQDAIAEMPSGGWIQVSGDAGELAQQYRFERLDPNPPGMGPGWIQLTKPEFEVYGSGGSVVILTGDSAMAFRSESVVESGTLTGNVLIERFESVHRRTVDRRRDRPTLIVETTEASFDNVIGEVRCEDDLHMEMLSGEFNGRGLNLLINDRDDVIQRLVIDVIDEIRLARREADTAVTTAGGPSMPSPAVASAAPAKDASPTEAGAAGPGQGQPGQGQPGQTRPGQTQAGQTQTGQTRPSQGQPSQADADPEPFYLLVLSDEVRIVQGTGATRRTGDGDLLRAIFTAQSEGFAPAIALGTPVDSGRPTRLAHRMGPMSWRETVATAAFGQVPATSPARTLTIAPPRRPTDTIITCRGPLTVVPAPVEDRLETSKDARLELIGAPVLLHDAAASADASCARLEWDVRRDRLELIGDETHPLKIGSPQLDAHADRFWLTQRDGSGGFAGAGDMTLLDATPDANATVAPTEQVRITWDEKVDLSFDATTEADALGALRTADFRGHVLARSADLAFSAAPDRRPGGTGELRAASLVIGFVPLAGDPDDTGGSGRVAPEFMKARGSVTAADAEQALWAEALDVWFRVDRAERERDTAETDSEVERILAEHDVRVRLPGGEHVFADRLRIDAIARTAVLEGTDVLLVDGGNLIDRGQRITIDDAQQRYVLTGRGRYRRFDRGFVMDASNPPDRAAVLDAAERAEELRITWRDGVEIFPADAAGKGLEPGAAGPLAARGRPRANLAHFLGDVVVVSPELRLTHADEMKVRFGAAPEAVNGEDEAGTRVEWIEARGDVHARSTGNPGAMRCDDLHVDLDENEGGQAFPTRLVARNGVHVADADQEMWAGELIVTFRERLDAEPTAPNAEMVRARGAAQETRADGEFAGARVDVEAVRARDAVQVRLARGERAFADSLFADGTNETAELIGARVVVLGPSYALDRGTHLVLNRGTGQYRVQSGGAFYQFAAPFDLPATGPTVVPDLDGERTIEATWTESALYVADADSGGGSLELRGDVLAESSPNSLEFNTIRTESLTLDFIEIHPTADGESSRKELARLVARGDARLENRTWLQENRSGTPRVFYVAGNYVQYDQQTLEAVVIGDGELLMRDEWDTGEPGAVPAAGGLGGKGTTLFRWQDTLHMTQAVDNRFNIVMTGEVQVQHLDVDKSPMTMTGDRIEATVERGSAGPEARADARPGALEFGGPMDPKRLYGRGGILIRSPERDVACDEFDYNVGTGLAEMNALPGSMVSILTRGSREPIRHERVLWDMRADTITVYRGGGGVGR